MTTALVRAIREEGPHASMDRVFERMWNYMQAANLTQTPVLGGKDRATRIFSASLPARNRSA